MYILYRLAKRLDDMISYYVSWQQVDWKLEPGYEPERSGQLELVGLSTLAKITMGGGEGGGHGKETRDRRTAY